jgi:long-chain acyl-CoA synthetase
MAALGFWKTAQENPDWIAVIEEAGPEYRAGEILAHANQTVHALRALGLREGDGVALLAPNVVGMVEVYAAALQAGLYYSPVNFHLTGPEIAYIVADAEAKAFFCHARFADLGLATVAELAARGRSLPREAAARSPASPRSGSSVPGTPPPCPSTAPSARPCTTPPVPPASPRACAGR